MARFRNFRLWRGRLPHWRADGETYYVTFRHRRPLAAAERDAVFDELRRLAMKGLDLQALCVLPEATELIFTPPDGDEDGPFEFADLIEKAKTRAGRKIIKKSGERWAPIGQESYDRIIRDEAELGERWDAILESPVGAGECEEPEDYACLWMADAPEGIGKEAG